MFCVHCGKQIDDGTKFCHHCGGRLEQPSAPEQPEIMEQLQQAAPQNAPQAAPQVVPQTAPAAAPQSAPQFIPQSAVSPAPVVPAPSVIPAPNPAGMASFLAPLPFIAISGSTVVITGFAGQSFYSICSEILAMLILAFLVNLLDSFIPKGKKWFGWYLYRFLTVMMAMVLHYVIHWLTTSYIPAFLSSFAPMLLLGILALMLLLGAVKVVLGVILVAVNPILGALYTFFFANTYGKQVTKAVLTTAILSVLVLLLEYMVMTAIGIAASMLIAYIPLILILLAIWYLLGHVL